MTREDNSKKPTASASYGEPFDSMEQLWFWFIAANEAKNSGARYTAGMAAKQRPCEPADVLAVMDRLFRNRFLTIQHLRVLKFYGVRGYAPDKHYYKERRAYFLWKEALAKLRTPMERKGMVREIPIHLRSSHNIIHLNQSHYQHQSEGVH